MTKQEENFEKLFKKYYEILKNDWSVLNICWYFEKNLSHFGKNLGKFWEPSRFLKNFELTFQIIKKKFDNLMKFSWKLT